MSLPGLFVTGTDTGVGKTVVAAGIVRALKESGHRAGAIKPIASSGIPEGNGLFVTPDTRILGAALGPEIPLERITPIAVQGDIAPSVGLRMRPNPMRFSHVHDQTIQCLAWWSIRADVMIVEGVGGLLCPITDDAVIADLAIALDYPLIIVARRGLGTLNHTLLTLEAARTRGLRVAGVILNGSEPSSNILAESTNPQELASRLGEVAILAEIAHEPASLTGVIAALGVKWWELAKPPRLAHSPPA
jgi:dethiobiotin synthetase